MKNPTISFTRLAFAALLLATPLRSQDIGPSNPVHVPIIVKPGLVESDLAKASLTSTGKAVPGESAAFDVHLGAIPTAHLTNGKLKMRFNAFQVQAGTSSATLLKLIYANVDTNGVPQTLTTGDFATASEFKGNTVIDLMPDDVTQIQFELDAATFEGEDDFLLLIVGYAAYPATGSASVVYEGGTFFAVDCPEAVTAN